MKREQRNGHTERVKLNPSMRAQSIRLEYTFIHGAGAPLRLTLGAGKVDPATLSGAFGHFSPGAFQCELSKKL